MIIVRTAESAEEALAERRMHCPRSGCGGTLMRWGFGRRRRIRGLGAVAIEPRPWARQRLGLAEPLWTLIGLHTGGRLLAPPG
jgi:hypothetical protein